MVAFFVHQTREREKNMADWIKGIVDASGFVDEGAQQIIGRVARLYSNRKDKDNWMIFFLPYFQASRVLVFSEKTSVAYTLSRSPEYKASDERLKALLDNIFRLRRKIDVIRKGKDPEWPIKMVSFVSDSIAGIEHLLSLPEEIERAELVSQGNFNDLSWDTEKTSPPSTGHSRNALNHEGEEHHDDDDDDDEEEEDPNPGMGVFEVGSDLDLTDQGWETDAKEGESEDGVFPA